REQLAAFHSARYVPEQIVIAAAGSVEHDALVDMARQLAGAPAPAADAVGAPGAAAARSSANGSSSLAPDSAPDFARRVRFLEKDTEQYHVCIGGAGMARDDERRFALRV